MKPVIKCAMIAATLVMTSACGRQPNPTVASASVIAASSLCQVDRPLVLRPAPAPDANDTGNVFDTDETTEALLEHNARYRAACPDGE